MNKLTWGQARCCYGYCVGLVIGFSQYHSSDGRVVSLDKKRKSKLPLSTQVYKYGEPNKIPATSLAAMD